MSYEAWGEPDGRPYPKAARIRVEEGDFRGFMGLTPCAPDEPTRRCSICARHCPALGRQIERAAVLIDATIVTPQGLPCPLFAPRSEA